MTHRSYLAQPGGGLLISGSQAGELEHAVWP